MTDEFNEDDYCKSITCDEIQDVEKNIKKLKINYPNGYLEINFEIFFSITLDEAKKIFSLIYKYSTENEKDILQNFFVDNEKEYYLLMKEYVDKAMLYSEGSKMYKKYFLEFEKTGELLNHIKKNRETFEMGRNSI